MSTPPEDGMPEVTPEVRAALSEEFGGDDTDTEGAEPTKPGSEAARWRTKLRETEAERDGLRGQVETYQRAQVAAIAAEKLADAGDLYQGGVTLADLVGEDGQVDRGAVLGAADALLKVKPHYAANAQSWPDLGGGRRGGAVPTLGPSWGEVISGRAR